MVRSSRPNCRSPRNAHFCFDRNSKAGSLPAHTQIPSWTEVLCLRPPRPLHNLLCRKPSSRPQRRANIFHGRAGVLVRRCAGVHFPVPLLGGDRLAGVPATRNAIATWKFYREPLGGADLGRLACSPPNLFGTPAQLTHRVCDIVCDLHRRFVSCSCLAIQRLWRVRNPLRDLSCSDKCSSGFFRHTRSEHIWGTLII